MELTSDANDIKIMEKSALSINGINVICRSTDGYIDATELCRAGKKLFKDWYRLKRTEQLIKAINDRGEFSPDR